MQKNNSLIRTALKNAGITIWELADHMKVSEATMIRRLRHELSISDRDLLLEAIKSLSITKEETR